MKTINSLSGGKTSSYIAVHYPADYEVFSLVCIDDEKCRPKDQSIVKYANQKLEKFIPEFGEFIATAEDDKTLYVMRDLEQLIGREIIWVRGKSYDRVIDEGTQTRLPSWARRYCTIELKLLPIFTWWFLYIGEKCKMRIGFRADEFIRMERFFNNSSPGVFKIPVNCSLRGQRRQRHKDFNWRYCSMPLIRDGITEESIKKYWAKNGFVGGTLFDPQVRQMDFPVISNCVGCFHKSIEVLAAMASINPEKMEWFSDQENKEMGTWLDSKKTYEAIISNKNSLAKEVLFEIENFNQSCDSGGCMA